MCTPADFMLGHKFQTAVDSVLRMRPEPEVRGMPGLDYFYNLRERLKELHKLPRKALADAGARQKRDYKTRC